MYRFSFSLRYNVYLLNEFINIIVLAPIMKLIEDIVSYIVNILIFKEGAFFKELM